MQIITDQLQKELKEHGNYQFPILVSEERLSRYESGAFLWHWHPEPEITLIQEGEMIYKVNDAVFHLRKGEALFGNTSCLHTGSKYQNQDCRYTAITFDPKLIYGYDNSLLYQKYAAPILTDFSFSALHLDLTENWHKEAISLLKNITLWNQQAYETYEFDIIIGLQQFWKLLYSNYPGESSISPHDKISYERIRSILAYIEGHYSEKISLDTISGQIHLCKSECCRLFKRYMKISLFHFLLEYRIEKSLAYLVKSDYSITEIANKVGFHDSNYYAKVFLKYKGCSPRVYRKMR